MKIIIYKVSIWTRLFHGGNYAFKLVDKNGHIVAESDGAYELLEDCENAALFIKFSASKSKIIHDFNRDED